MIDIVKRTCIGAILLMVLPILIWISDWQWYFKVNYYWLKTWYWITQTATLPWSIITSILLINQFFLFLQYRFRPMLDLSLILLVTLFIGQAVKLIVKKQVHEPRPYIIYLNDHYISNNTRFKDVICKSRFLSLNPGLQQKKIFPIWLRKYWNSKDQFAFPSGHAIFVSIWSLISIDLLWSRYYHRMYVYILMVWAVSVMISRITLGMHWPQDIVMGIAISWLFATIACWLLRRVINDFV